MYKHILVPTDGSELSSDAIDQACMLARSLGARVTLLYVQPDYPQPIVGEGALIAPEHRDDYLRGAAELAEKVLREAAMRVTLHEVSVDTHTEVSDRPWQVIVHVAEQRQCDLVFMASHGRRGLAGLLIGSETHKVLTHCKTPVLVYR
ncbi:universal stress protein [Uliginosibacterium sp. H1]|uniref:universal stress protein n=1 Tax=Uliginosibacterium sp. H1 TaxID=3114757 RepID=UPI002E1946E4|nr:universal stress protein [Uliginosibacterium sp. H1]